FQRRQLTATRSHRQLTACGVYPDLSGRSNLIGGAYFQAPAPMDVANHDILLVGGGGAGLRDAIAVSEVNPKLSVAVVSKVYPMRSHTVSLGLTSETAIAARRPARPQIGRAHV